MTIFVCIECQFEGNVDIICAFTNEDRAIKSKWDLKP